MPFLPQSEKDKELIEGQGTAETPLLSAQGADISQNAAPNAGESLAKLGAAQTAPVDKQSNTGFTNLSKYLDANRDQSIELANTVGQKVTEGLGDAGESLNNIITQFNTASDAGVDPSLFNKISSTTPMSQEDKDKISNTRRGISTAPMRLEDSEGFNNSNNLISQSQERAGQIFSDEGRKTLLSSIQKNRQASSGVTGLNNIFLAGKPQQQILQESAAQVDPLTARLNDAKSASVARAGEGVANRQAAITAALDAEQDRVKTAFGGANRVEQTNRAAEIARARQGLQLAPDDREAGFYTRLASVGVSQEQFREMNQALNALPESERARFDDLSGYLQPTDSTKTKLDANQLAKLKTLTELSGNVFSEDGLSADLKNERFDLQRALADIRARR